MRSDPHSLRAIPSTPGPPLSGPALSNPPLPEGPSLPDRMDRLYRFERYWFDLTRPFYLIGRDQTLDQIRLGPGQSLLEIGVGTARNLIRLARRFPESRLFGVDVSRLMLEIAQKKVKKTSLGKRVVLFPVQGDETDYLSPLHPGHYDQVLLSFCLTMVDDPIRLLRAALRSLRPGGILHIADYYDQGGLPAWCRHWIQKGMRRYGVRGRPEILEFLRTQPGSLTLKPALLRIGYSIQFQSQDKTQ